MGTKYVYKQEVFHSGLNKYQILKAETSYELDMKVTALMAKWDEEWSKKVEREKKIKSDEDSINYANEMTQQAENIQKELNEIVLMNLEPQALDLDKLKDFSKYPEPKPKATPLLEIPEEPLKSHMKYNPTPSFFTRILKKKMSKFIADNMFVFECDHEAWEKSKSDIESQNLEISRKNDIALEQWKSKRDEFLRIQAEKNEKIDEFYEKYKSGDIESVEKYFVQYLEGIKLPFEYSKSIEVEYDASTKSMIVDILLPNIDDIPNVKSVSYVKSKKEFKITNYTESYLNKKYDSVIYQIVLIFLNYIFAIDSKQATVDMVIINGKINSIDKATGKNIEPYILSISVAKDVFKDLNLSAVDPRAWFKSSKGISAASLANVTPIAPVVIMSRDDKRFVEGYNVSDMLDENINLASIDWQDFENLIREIFEKEFNTNGGEVKITQASRDGGVDAVAFDPDPIRGGKIVIQAKRYTNIVGVSAVRDLYGTVLNEGATKGILVTTSNYGNDAYNFAQGKPLTLMNGANLLYLLQKHGYKARIDLKEAKDTLKG